MNECKIVEIRVNFAFTHFQFAALSLPSTATVLETASAARSAALLITAVGLRAGARGLLSAP